MADRSNTSTGVYYDPYDLEIDADPYPMFRRLRDEAPLYYNEQHDFYALSRFDDVERGAARPEDLHLRPGQRCLELIKADIEMPPGMFIFEDPPVHTIHRGLLSRVFTPRKMAALEDQVRAFCAGPSTRSSARAASTSSPTSAREMPMKTIGMLLGIPDEDQDAIRDRIDAQLRTRGRHSRWSVDARDGPRRRRAFADYIDWRAEHPSDDLMTELLNAEFEDETAYRAAPHPRRDPHLRQRRSPAPATRPPPGSSAGPARSSPSTPTSGAELVEDRAPDPERHRGAPALRAAGAGQARYVTAGRRALRPDRPGGQHHAARSSARPTATSASSPTPTASTSTARSATT